MSLASRLRRLIPLGHQPAARYRYEQWRRLAEREMADFCGRVRHGDHVVDVGANVGVYTHALTLRGATVESFEPQPELLPVLRAYAALHPNVHVHPVALGAIAGRARLAIPAESGAVRRAEGSVVCSSGAAFAIARGAESGLESGIDVDVRTLDSYGFADVRAIKIDVEGFELEVLRGAASTIARSRPVLLVEVERRHRMTPMDEVFAYVMGLGYRVSFLLPNTGWSPLAEFDASSHQRLSELANGGLYVNNFLCEPV